MALGKTNLRQGATILLLMFLPLSPATAADFGKKAPMHIQALRFALKITGLGGTKLIDSPPFKIRTEISPPLSSLTGFRNVGTGIAPELNPVDLRREIGSILPGKSAAAFKVIKALAGAAGFHWYRPVYDGAADDKSPTEVVASEINTVLNAIPAQGPMIEIGGANRPLCESCLQMDIHGSYFDVYAKQYSRAMGRPASREEVMQAFEAETSFQKGFLNYDKWAAAKPGGVIANANRLPFKNNSMSAVISKGFPWFGPSSTKTIIEPILREYRRVLSQNGAIILLATGGDFSHWELHIRIAHRLGFLVSSLILESPYSSGLILTKHTIARRN